MAPAITLGICEECNKRFEYTLLHNGLNNSSYCYCRECGNVAVLDMSESRFPLELLKKSAYRAGAEGLEQYLEPCSCGGAFSSSAAPRCPHCGEPLSAAKAASYIERNAPPKTRDWHWQMNWSGNYCMIVEGRMVRNNFKKQQ